MLMHVWGGPWNPWTLLFPWLWIAVVVFAVLMLRPRRGGRRSGSAEQVLGERYARGEISAEQYHERLAVLRDGSA